MNTKNCLLISVLLALAGVYVYYFTGWFAPKIIHITSINARTTRVRRASADPAIVPVIFKLGRPYKLTDLKVVALDEWQTNKNCVPLWHLIADTNSMPVAHPFVYGQRIPGMKPEISGERPQPLRPGIKYRLIITDGSARGQHDFQPVSKAAGQ
jgi:hypothetical protein